MTEELVAAYAEAYKFGYALVDHYRIFYQNMTKVRPDGSTQQLNELSGEARFYGPEDKTVLSPNNDTPYSMGYLDLRNGWCSLTIPNTDGLEESNRYNSFQCVDMFTNNVRYISVTEPGEENPISSGKKTGQYAFYKKNMNPPADQDSFDGVYEVNSDFIFLIGRTQMYTKSTEVEQEAEEQTVQAIMDSFTSGAEVPSEGFPSNAVPAEGETIDGYSGSEFFNILAYTLQFQTPPPGSYEDDYLSPTLANLGVIPGRPFFGDADAAEAGKEQALPEIVAGAQNIGVLHEGWDMMNPADRFFVVENAEDAFFRSLVAKKGIYANNPNEAYYPVAGVDIAGDKLNGSNVYRLELDNPPVGAFWSLTMYRLSDGFLVENPINRYSIGTDRVEINEDNKIPVEVRAVPDGETAPPNVLPAPSGEDFYVVLRLYLPLENVLNGTWKPPGFQKVS